MLWAILKWRKQTSIVLIDAFSSRAFWYTYMVSRVCQFLQIPYIPILHGGDFPNRLAHSKKACQTIFLNSAINISPSFYLKEHFENNNFRVKYIPNFLEVENYPFLKRENFAPRLLWVRSFHQLYNPSLAIEILASLQNKFPAACLCMVGPDKDGSLLMVKKRAVALGVGNAVVFTGLLPKKDWVLKSKGYDILINTTNFDNMPISVIEAMALGLPIVSTNVGGLPYLIENGKDGVLVEPGSADVFVEAIEKILSTSQHGQKLAENARLKASTFDWSILRKDWEKTINDYKRF